MKHIGTDGWPEALAKALEVGITALSLLQEALDELEKARNIPGLPKGMKIKRMWISSVDECVAGAELEPLLNEVWF